MTTSPNFVRKTQLDGLEFLLADDSRVIGLYGRLTAFVRRHLGEETASLFAEPVMSRRGGKRPSGVSWYAAHAGDPASLTELQSGRAGPEQELRDHLAALCDLLDDEEDGPVLRASLYITDPDDILVVGDRVLLTNWGLAPHSVVGDWRAQERLFARTLGRYAPFSCQVLEIPTTTHMSWTQWGADGQGPEWTSVPTGLDRKQAERPPMVEVEEDEPEALPAPAHAIAPEADVPGDLAEAGRTVIGTIITSETANQGKAFEAVPEAAAQQGRAVNENTLLNFTYQLEQFIAKGGMGEVWRARNVALNTTHAIKIILPEYARNKDLLALFSAEAYHLRKVHHDAIVGYEGTMLDESGQLYLVMEFVDGPSLVDRLRQGPLEPEEVIKLRDRLANGLAAAHDQHVFHRDMSPDNVILPGGDLARAKIIDFGIAKGADNPEVTILREGFGGKLSYASPEQLRIVDGEVDARSDMYSLGLVLAAAALGRPLNMGRSFQSAAEARRTVPDLSDIAKPLIPTLTRMLQPKPSDRPDDMRALLALDETTDQRKRWWWFG